MAVAIDLISATVQVEAPIAEGRRTVGAGFLLADPTPDGQARIVLVTAEHVFEKMPGDQATVGFRVQGPDGTWRYAPQKFAIRDHGRPLWTRHPSRDVAAIAIVAPPAFARAAIPLNWLGGDDAFARRGLGPGDEMMALGFPEGLSSNAAGFPILRAGRVASYPLGPATQFPTFLLDFRVFPGNSGGPVFVQTDPAVDPSPLIAGMLTQQVQVGEENLGIGIVTQAKFIRETVAQLDTGGPAGAKAPADGADSADTVSVTKGAAGQAP